MGRRSEHSPEHLRELIITASERIIASEGLAGLSAREIARSVGYSPGTIYNIFDSLDDLVLQVEARLLDALHERLTGLPVDGSARERVTRLARAYLQFTIEHPRLWNLLFEHHLPRSHTMPQWYQEKLDALLAQVEAALRPLLRNADPSETARSARALWASVHGITSLATADKLSSISTDGAQALIEHLVEVYVAGLETCHRHH